MGKLLSDRERRLQRKLIPLNIFVWILSLVAAFSLMFMPVLKVDFGKILSNEDFIAYVEGTVEKMVGDAVNGQSKDSGDDGALAVDYTPVIAAIVKNVLSSAEGTVTISSYNASKVAFAKGDDKADKVMDELFFGDDALVSKLIDSIADNVVEIFKEDEGKDLIEEVVVTAIATSLIAGLTEGATEKLTGENVSALTDTFKKIDNVTDSEGASEVADEFIDQLDSILGDDFNKEKDGEAIHDYIMSMYEEAAEETDEISVETMISIAISKNVDLKKYKLDSILGGGNSEPSEEAPEQSAVRKRAVDGEVGGTEEPDKEGEGEAPETGDGEDENETPETGDNGNGGDETGDGEDEDKTPEDGDDEDDDVPPVAGGNTDDNEQDEDRVICKNYSEILAEMGLGAEDEAALKTNLKTTLHNLVDEKLGEYSKYLGYYGYLFYGMLAFIAPWLILFLFSFIRTFTKNKRFMMWYVKLYSFIPGLISVALMLAPKLISKFKPDWFSGENGTLIKAALGGVSSMMWISGICYLLLWLVSIFWAFPIKHKIRKERKIIKSYGGSSYDGGNQGGGKKNKKDKQSKKNAPAQNGGYYQPQPRPYDYGNDPYRGNPYGNGYGNGYDSGPYGGYGNGYNNPYGGNQYGGGYNDGYGGSYYDDDQDGFNSPYTGSYYGSYLSDDDDY